MRRNNVVFMVGEVITYKCREMEIAEGMAPVVDILLLTDPVDVSGQHKILVQGQQAVELTYILTAATDHPLEVMVLGWLYSEESTSIVIAERVTAILDNRTRKRIVTVMRKHRA